MSDLEKWEVHGPVKSMKKSHANWDPSTKGWIKPGAVHFASFRADGKLIKTESQNPDGSVSFCEWNYDERGSVTHLRSGMRGGVIVETQYLYDKEGRHVRTVVSKADGSSADSESCAYDHLGRKTKTASLRNPGFNVSYQIEGTSTAVNAPGAITMSTTYDDNNLPSEVRFLNIDGKIIQRVTLLRDRAGRLLSETVTLLGATPWQGMYFAEQQEAVEAALSQIFADGFSSISHTYDPQGRLIQRQHRMGTLVGSRSTFRYEDRDEPIEETVEQTAQQASFNEDGSPRYLSGPSTFQHNRFEYSYDPYGNWTSRTVSMRLEYEPEFRLSHIEQREIDYYVAGTDLVSKD